MPFHLILIVFISFDVDFPIECDDEYWMNYDQQLAFKQPEGKPAIITYFIWTLRQGHIIDSIFRNLVRNSVYIPRRY